MSKDKPDDGKVKYTKEELEDPIAGLAKELKKMKKRFKKLQRTIRSQK
jgi:chaperonin cofactor prefoldin